MRTGLTIGILLLLTASAFAHGMSAADQARFLNAGLMEFVWLGAKHMITGYDHILFLLGVVFFLDRFTDIVRFITAFTIGHSITLIFATLYGITVNYYLIDAVIALTVCYKAFENLDGFRKYLNSGSPNLTLMVFVFGLIHGFGLSTRLQQLPLGETGLVAKILAFNVGVELGQIAALVIMLLLLSAWRKSVSFEHTSRAANVVLLVIGGFLFLVQLHSFQHTAFAEGFPVSRDDHAHAHADMQAEKPPVALENYGRKLSIGRPGDIPSTNQ